MSCKKHCKKKTRHIMAREMHQQLAMQLQRLAMEQGIPVSPGLTKAAAEASNALLKTTGIAHQDLSEVNFESGQTLPGWNDVAVVKFYAYDCGMRQPMPPYVVLEEACWK